MTVEKESSILGYPGEVSRSLNADHHDVCKYSSRSDPNYMVVRNALSDLVKTIRSKSKLKNNDYPFAQTEFIRIRSIEKSSFGGDQIGQSALSPPRFSQ